MRKNMKPQLVALSSLLSLLLAVGSAYAQANQANISPTSDGECSKAETPGDVIAVGPPVLTRQSADCALDFIAFEASVVKGVKGMDVDQAMRDKWRAYLSLNYPALAPIDRVWFASAPGTMAAVRADWPKLSWLQRAEVRQRWAASMAPILQFMAPVVLTSEQGASRQSFARQMSDMIRQLQVAYMIQQQQQRAAAAQDLQVQKELFNNGARAITLQKGMQVQATDTINLMHAYSGH